VELISIFGGNGHGRNEGNNNNDERIRQHFLNTHPYRWESGEWVDERRKARWNFSHKY
jgi:hypothetical protein